MASEEPLVRAREIRKDYRDITIGPLSFDVHPGEVVGLVGANGAGKTTTLRVLTGLLRPTVGNVQIRGFDVFGHPMGARRLFGYMPEQPLLYEALTLEEFIQLIGSLRGLTPDVIDTRMHMMMSKLDLEVSLKQTIGTFSKGMRQKVTFIAAFIHQPRVAFLDEPTSGLDPRYARLMRNWIRVMASDGMAVVVSSHLVKLVEEICDRIILMVSGKEIVAGTIEEITSNAGTNTLEEAFVELVGGSGWYEAREQLWDGPE